MQALRELQTRFIDYLTGDSTDMESIIKAESRTEQQARLDIYKNAYRIRLRQVIETDHEMLWTYLGDELFEQMVNGYISSHPSHYTSLRNFCDRLPDYLAGTSPFDQHPIIAEIATFERLLMDVFDAGEAKLLCHQGDHVRLADGLAAADVLGTILVGGGTVGGGNERFASHVVESGKDALVVDAARGEVLVEHPAPGALEIRILLWVRSGFHVRLQISKPISTKRRGHRCEAQRSGHRCIR